MYKYICILYTLTYCLDIISIFHIFTVAMRFIRICDKIKNYCLLSHFTSPSIKFNLSNSNKHTFVCTYIHT